MLLKLFAATRHGHIIELQGLARLYLQLTIVTGRNESHCTDASQTCGRTWVAHTLETTVTGDIVPRFVLAWMIIVVCLRSVLLAGFC